MFCAGVLAMVSTPAATQVKWVPLGKVQSGAPKVSVGQAEAAPPATAPAAPQNTSPPVSIGAAPEIAVPVPAVQPPSVAASAQGALSLTCLGAGTANKVRGTFIGTGWGWATIASHHDRQFNDQVDVRLFNGDDRIRMPRTMLPGIHGGDHGWFRLHDVVADARSIRASAAVGMLNNPKVFIDRVTGTISISGKSGDYAGQCQAVDANSPAKF